MAVDLVAARREQRVLLVGTRRGDVGRPHHPDAHALVAAGGEDTRGQPRHLGVRGGERARVRVNLSPRTPPGHPVLRPGADGGSRGPARLPRPNPASGGPSRRSWPGAGATGTSGPVGTAPSPPSLVTSALMRPPVLLRAHRLDSGPVPLLGRRRSSRCSLVRRLRGVGRG